MVSLIIVGLYFVAQNMLGAESSLFIPPLAASMAGVSAAFSIGAYIFGREKGTHALALIAYLLTTATIWTLILLTGGAVSPFIALWLLAGVFAGLFGWWTWGVFWLAANSYVGYQLFFSGSNFGSDQIIAMLLVAESPLIASYVIWHNKTKQETSKDSKAFNALAKQLSQVADKSEIVINSIADGVVAIDAKGTIQLINPAAQSYLGWPKQDAMGLDYRSVLKLANDKGEPIPEETSPVRQVLYTNKSLTDNNIALMTRSGKRMFISLVVSPLGDTTPAAGAIAVFRDITREKEEERQKAEFISTASHEMRTPVAAIEGYLGLALNPQTAVIDDKARLYLQKAHESTQHLGRLFQDLLTVSKAEDARLVPRPVPVEVISFTREVTESLQKKAQDKGIILTFSPGSDSSGDGGSTNKRIMPSYYVLADQDHLREVLNNLIDNGIKYTKQGSVVVDIAGDPTNITISITDSGIGIPPEDVPHLFQKFYRVDNSETREIGGTGLGLYICRRLIEANNGTISVQSTFGKGSTFFVQLPRISNEQATASQPTFPAAA